MRRCLPSLVFASEHEVGTRCGLISERTGADPGCWTIADQPLRTLTKPQTFWHLDAYPTHSSACRTAKGAAQGRRRVSWETMAAKHRRYRAAVSTATRAAGSNSRAIAMSDCEDSPTTALPLVVADDGVAAGVSGGMPERQCGGHARGGALSRKPGCAGAIAFSRTGILRPASSATPGRSGNSATFRTT